MEAHAKVMTDSRRPTTVEEWTFKNTHARTYRTEMATLATLLALVQSFQWYQRVCSMPAWHQAV